MLFRYDAATGLGGKRLMLVLNKAREARELYLTRFTEMLRGGETATDVMTGQKATLGASLSLPARSVTLLSIE